MEELIDWMRDIKEREPYLSQMSRFLPCLMIKGIKLCSVKRIIIQARVHERMNLEKFSCSVTAEARLKYSIFRHYRKIPVFIKFSSLLFASESLVKRLMLDKKFDREMYVYQLIIPRLEYIQVNSIDKERYDKLCLIKNIFPLCYGSRDMNNYAFERIDRVACILLENLKDKFEQLNPRNDLDYHTAIIAVKKLAAFHALSLCYKSFDSKEFNLEVRQALRNIPSGYTACALTFHFRYMTKVFGNIEALKSSSSRLIAMLRYSKKHMGTPPNDSKWIGLCHGRCFSFNIMRSVNKDQITSDCRFLDLQQMSVRHILSDLAIFIITSGTREHFLRDNKLEALLKVYHQSLLAGLEQIPNSQEVFNFDNFKSELTINIQKEFLRGLLYIRYLSTTAKKVKFMRTLADYPNYLCNFVDNCIDTDIFEHKIKESVLCLLSSELSFDL